MLMRRSIRLIRVHFVLAACLLLPVFFSGTGFSLLGHDNLPGINPAHSGNDTKTGEDGVSGRFCYDSTDFDPNTAREKGNR